MIIVKQADNRQSESFVLWQQMAAYGSRVRGKLGGGMNKRCAAGKTARSGGDCGG
jgi:hypothetical protein